MNTLGRATAAIRRAEVELRGLLTEAATAAHYDEVLVLGEWARQLHGLIAASPLDQGEGGDDLAEPDIMSEESFLSPPLVPMTVKPSAPSKAANGRAAATKRAAKKQSKKGAVKVRKASPRSAYPQFLREGDQLIKIGWSKKEKKQYEHKAPKAVLDLLLASLLAAGQEGRRFTTEDILPLQEGGNGGEVPSYQAYLCLAWLRSGNLIEQHGRQGYSLAKPEAFSASVQESWDRVPHR